VVWSFFIFAGFNYTCELRCWRWSLVVWHFVVILYWFDPVSEIFLVLALVWFFVLCVWGTLFVVCMGTLFLFFMGSDFLVRFVSAC